MQLPTELYILYTHLPVFALVLARLGGLLMFQPVLGAVAIPMQVRALLVLGLAALVAPAVAVPSDLPDTPAGLILAMANEVFLGALVGLVGAAVFLGVQWGAMLIAQETGIAFGQLIDPSSEEEETVLGVFYLQLAAVVYLLAGGHRILVATCLDTLHSLPLLGDTNVFEFGPDLLARAMATGARVALQIAAPTLLALFLVNLALGFVSRTLPQLNVLAVGFSVKSLVAFILIAASLPTAMEVFLSAISEVYDLLGTAIT